MNLKTNLRSWFDSISYVWTKDFKRKSSLKIFYVCRIIADCRKTLLIELIKKLDKGKSNILVGKFIKTKNECNFFKRTI